MGNTKQRKRSQRTALAVAKYKATEQLPVAREVPAEVDVRFMDLMQMLTEAQRQLAQERERVRKLDNEVRVNRDVIGHLKMQLMGRTMESDSRFSQSDIDSLIRLCHPDKHGNSSAANSMTVKLLTMRGR